MSARRPGPLWLAVLVVGALVAGAFAVGRSQASNGSGDARADVATVANAGALPGLPAGSDPIAYGVAEPAGSLPGVETAADVASWSAIRADVIDSGACWLRSDLDRWLAHAIEAFNWLGSPLSCTASTASPIKVLAILDQQTVWDATRLCPAVTFSTAFRGRRSAFTLDDWGLLVHCIATQFAGRISAYEIWNEPLLSNSMLGYEDGTAAHYFELLRVADTEIKSVDPNATVIALGGSDLFAGGDLARLVLMRSFSTDLLALGAARYADAISLHAYSWDVDDEAVWTSYEDELSFEGQAWSKPVWITETGQRSTDAESQAAYMAMAYRLFVSAGVGHIFWFSITDQPDGEFGLRGRPVESALRLFALENPTGQAPPDGQVPARVP